MKVSLATHEDLGIIRATLRDLQPGSAHQARFPPEPSSIFTPARHANALDPQRVLVIGNRGVGKSFWSSVLTHESTRNAVSPHYPRLALSKIQAVLGFHEDAGKDGGAAPSPALLSDFYLKHGHSPESIWRAVLIRSLSMELNDGIHTSLRDALVWSSVNTEDAEEYLRDADNTFYEQDRVFLIVFDALDRLGDSWDVITPLTQGVLRLALDMRGFRALKAKVFMRTDQSKNDSLFRFSDASKLRSDSVHLVWRREELYGLLYKHLIASDDARDALFQLAGEDTSLMSALLGDAAAQQELFYRLAGEYMGGGPKRGRTYTWLYDHLADTFGETSPRSFITAVQKAATHSPQPRDTVIDYAGIRAGVQEASVVRVRELKEDYDWIEDVLDALEGLEVPCEPQLFVSRWRARGTIRKMTTGVSPATPQHSRLLPLEVSTDDENPEAALLQALANIGVVEFRTEVRINVPDLFRVAARIKRRGGVRPPPSRS